MGRTTNRRKGQKRAIRVARDSTAAQNMVMATTSVESERLQQALDACVVPLRTLARYQLEPPLVQRLEAMGERKEFLSPEEHAELIALVEFARRRQIEKLQAEVALERLRSTFPDLVETT